MYLTKYCWIILVSYIMLYLIVITSNPEMMQLGRVGEISVHWWSHITFICNGWDSFCMASRQVENYAETAQAC